MVSKRNIKCLDSHLQLQSEVKSERTSKRRKLRFSAPPRLTWGGVGTSIQTRDRALWVEKYAPKDSNELCVANKKVKEVRSWIETRSPSEKLLILVGSPGIGKSTMLRLLAKEFQLTLHEWSDSYANQLEPSQSMSVKQMSPLRSFEQFLQCTGAGFSSVLQSGSHKSATKSIILLDELPNLHTTEAEVTFRALLNQHLEGSNVPTIMIFSDVSEGQHKPADLERLVDPKYLYSNFVEIVRVHSVTNAKLKKVCSEICKRERIKPPDWGEFNLQCHGDIRHAIMTLQFRGKNNDRGTRNIRDSKLSTFHALGKILYAKRQKVSTDNRERPPLAFNPEKVMEGSDMGLGGALTFLGYHSPSFFTDITELSHAFDNFSDATYLLDLKVDAPTRQFDVIFPNGYVASLGGRAIADANKNPAPSTFRALSAPKVFAAYRKSRANESTMLQLCKRLSVGDGKLSLDTYIGASQKFVTDHLPFMRTILPKEVDSALGSLYSFVGSNDTVSGSTEEDSDFKNIAEQEAILAEDDIVDDNDDDDDGSFGQVSATELKVTQSESKVLNNIAKPAYEIITIDD